MIPRNMQMIIMQELPNGDEGCQVVSSLSAYDAIMVLLPLTNAEERYAMYNHLQNEFEYHRIQQKEHMDYLFKQAEEERIKKQREQEYGEVAGHS